MNLKLIKSKAGYRDYAADNGYVYRVHKDNSVRLMKSPRADYAPDGREVKKGTTAYEAILARVKAYRQERAAGAISQAVSVAKSFQKQSRAVPAEQATEEEDLSVEEEEEAPTRWGLILGIPTAITAVIGIALALRR